jgi:methionyl aminopeptidase
MILSLDAKTDEAGHLMKNLGMENTQNSTNLENNLEKEAQSLETPTQKPKKKKKKKPTATISQTSPPTILVSSLFQNDYPVGEIQNYKNENSYRTTSEELRHIERLNNDIYNEVRLFIFDYFSHAAEVHRQVRKYAQSVIKPGMSMIEIVNSIENGTRNILGDNGTNQRVLSFKDRIEALGFLLEFR